MLEIGGQLVEQGAPHGERDPIGFGFQLDWPSSGLIRRPLVVEFHPGDAVERVAEYVAVPIGEGGQLRLRAPVDPGDRLRFLGEDTVKEPRQGAGFGRDVLEGGGGMVFVARERQVGDESGIEDDRLEFAAAVGGQAGLGDLADVSGDKLRQALGAIEVAAGAVDEVRQRPVGMVLALVEDAGVSAADVVP